LNLDVEGGRGEKVGQDVYRLRRRGGKEKECFAKIVRVKEGEKKKEKRGGKIMGATNLQ